MRRSVMETCEFELEILSGINSCQSCESMSSGKCRHPKRETNCIQRWFHLNNIQVKQTYLWWKTATLRMYAHQAAQAWKRGNSWRRSPRVKTKCSQNPCHQYLETIKSSKLHQTSRGACGDTSDYLVSRHLQDSALIKEGLSDSDGPCWIQAH